MKEQLESLNSISINFGENGMMIVNILLAFIMFGVALGIKLDTFKNVFRHPKSIITGILLQWVGLPAVTFLICLALNHWITPMVALGMILVASCPGGNISNFISSLSKGNVELSVSMTAVTTVFAPLITPLNFYLWGTLYYHAISVSGDIPRLVIPFLPMLWQILLLLGIPIVLGMLFARYFPNATKKITKPAQTLSILLFLVMVVASFAQNFQLFIDNIIFIFCIVLVHNAAAFPPLRDHRGRHPELRPGTGAAVQPGHLPSGDMARALRRNALCHGMVGHLAYHRGTHAGSHLPQASPSGGQCQGGSIIFKDNE